jgi:outer membrane biosynthesis protein TonB
MTTAEFMIGRSADDAIEKKQEVKKIGWALLAALFLHLVIGYVIAASHGLFASATPIEEDKPVELTIVDVPKPAVNVPKNPMFMETDPMKQTAEPPKEKTFESNANSVAASEIPATGGMPLPSQQGKERPMVDLETHDYSLSQKGAQPQPTPVEAQPSPSVAPSVAPKPTSTPLPNEFAMLRATPTPVVQPSVAPPPQPPSSSYRAQKQQTRLSGAISNRGASSVNAVGTPLGRYQKLVNDSVGSHWYMYVRQRGDLVSIGTARLVFSVDRGGHVRNLKVLQNSSNEAFANVCLQSVQDISLPPIPSDVAEVLPPEGMDAEMTFTLSSDR